MPQREHDSLGSMLETQDRGLNRYVLGSRFKREEEGGER